MYIQVYGEELLSLLYTGRWVTNGVARNEFEKDISCIYRLTAIAHGINTLKVPIHSIYALLYVFFSIHHKSSNTSKCVLHSNVYDDEHTSKLKKIVINTF